MIFSIQLEAIAIASLQKLDSACPLNYLTSMLQPNNRKEITLMRNTLKLAIVSFLWLLPCAALATTWDEPWHERVVKEADSFVKVQVVKNENGKQLVLKTLKQLAGASAPAEFTVDRFWLLQLTSMSGGHGPEFRLAPGAACYVFVKKNSTGENWALPTPTAGYAKVEGECIVATYRHSYHMALVSQTLYEPTMTAIFQFLHSQPYDTQFIEQLFKQQLTVPPQNVTDDMKSEQSQRFFAQHVALECFYYFGTEKDYGLLEPFLSQDAFHVQISAIRALSAVKTEKAGERLLEFIRGKGNSFAKVMAVWGIRRLNAKDRLPTLLEYVGKAPDEEAGFGGSIMDPRVGTHFPSSVKAAVEELAKEWNSSKDMAK